MDIGHYFYKSSSIYSSNFEGDLLNIVHEDVSNNVDIKFQYRLSEGPINDQLLEWIKNHPQKKIWTKREKLIRILTAQRRLPIRNELPQEFISSQLNVKRNTLKTWIDSLIAYGYLEFLSDLPFGKGFKAKSYKAKSALKDNILNEFGYKTVKELKNSTPKVVLPKSIKDGHWNDTLFLCAFNFAEDSTSDRFIEWVKTIPNWDKKAERITQARNCWKNRHLYLKKDS